MNVIKRDGRLVSFDQEKIRNAILKSFIAVDGSITDYAREKARNISEYIASLRQDLSVEEIQDLVEKGLMSCKRKDVAKAYILYREERSRERTYNTEIMRIAREKILAENVQNQNANLDERSFGGRVGEMSSAILKRMALDKFMSARSRNNHLNNEVYIHDLDHWVLGSHNCLTIPFDDLLEKGFNTRQMDIRPAGSVSSAMQLVAVIFQLQSLQQFGGVSASHIDWTMVPYVRKSFFKHYRDGVEFIEGHELDYSFHNALSIDEGDYKVYSPRAYEYAMKMTEKETYQAVEAMYHNLNTLQSRSGNQNGFPKKKFLVKNWAKTLKI